MRRLSSEGEERERVIPKISDTTAYRTNCEAIDRLIGECRYPYIVAWGKFLGFAPATVIEYVQQAEADNAPAEAIQKIEDEWILVSSIQNEINRKRVLELATPR